MPLPHPGRPSIELVTIDSPACAGCLGFLTHYILLTQKVPKTFGGFVINDYICSIEIEERWQLHKLRLKLMTFYTDNPELLEVLQEQGISVMCAEDMAMEISEEDAERIESVILEYAPAAIHDYVIG